MTPDRRQILAGGALLAGGAAAGARLRPSSPPAAAPWGDAALTHTRVIWKVETDQPLVALTFDDGPQPANTAAVLDVLAAKGVHATFNVVGLRAERHAALLRRLRDAGHQIGNHSWSHADFDLLDRAGIAREMQRGAETVAQLSGVTPRCFRPPHGRINAAVLQEASRLDSDVVLWSVQLHEKAYNVAGNVRYVAERIEPGSIVLAHDAGNLTRRVGLRALPGLIDATRARGFRFVTVAELLAAAPPRIPRMTAAMS